MNCCLCGHSVDGDTNVTTWAGKPAHTGCTILYARLIYVEASVKSYIYELDHVAKTGEITDAFVACLSILREIATQPDYYSAKALIDSVQLTGN